MGERLKHAGIVNEENIAHYSLRTETENDILKIYYTKQKGEIFQRSLKLKFPRQRKRVLVDSGLNRYEDTSEIDANLVHILKELDAITDKRMEEADMKGKILKDLRHLEKVVSHKIREIEADLERLK